ncbi:MAG: hypothetical protein LBM17_06945 [Candidatus Accumulibacter sp.]|jgi:hypothetical protein|nr:hypothetical protein [Accumulibacter sp.]
MGKKRAHLDRPDDFLSSFIHWLCEEDGFERLGMAAYFCALFVVWIHTGSFLAGIVIGVLFIVPIGLPLMLACLLVLFVASIAKMLGSVFSARRET